MNNNRVSKIVVIGCNELCERVEHAGPLGRAEKSRADPTVSSDRVTRAFHLIGYLIERNGLIERGVADGGENGLREGEMGYRNFRSLDEMQQRKMLLPVCSKNSFTSIQVELSSVHSSVRLLFRTYQIGSFQLIRKQKKHPPYERDLRTIARCQHREPSIALHAARYKSQCTRLRRMRTANARTHRAPRHLRFTAYERTVNFGNAGGRFGAFSSYGHA
ncbi:hypothetical protein EVAR_943_1 [Eumeta japonica]|uniref:Uncharacterized protein n=1 Tax=Eumeta variegata TaxID=151549 RepID=A0A4C1SDZ4_EUMVA|nr:hypothetical protein EVAR_943_1 [Eumeta japonica]